MRKNLCILSNSEKFYAICLWRHNSAVDGPIWIKFFYADRESRADDDRNVKMEPEIYFRFLFWWRIANKNVKMKVYLLMHTKFRQGSLIRGHDITISGLWKQTAAILKF